MGEYRRVPHETTGFTPSELLYGRQIRGPLQSLKERWTAEKSMPTDVINYIVKVQEKFEALQQASKEHEEQKK